MRDVGKDLRLIRDDIKDYIDSSINRDITISAKEKFNLVLDGNFNKSKWVRWIEALYFPLALSFLLSFHWFGYKFMFVILKSFLVGTFIINLGLTFIWLSMLFKVKRVSELFLLHKEFYNRALNEPLYIMVYFIGRTVYALLAMTVFGVTLSVLLVGSGAIEDFIFVKYLKKFEKSCSGIRASSDL